jgi:hypothetical protein
MPNSRKAMMKFRPKKTAKKREKKRGKKTSRKLSRKTMRKTRRKIYRGGVYIDYWDDHCDAYRDKLRDIYEYREIVMRNGHKYKSKPAQASDKYIKIYREKFKFFQKIDEDAYNDEQRKNKDKKQEPLGLVSMLKREGKRDTFPEEVAISETGESTHDLKKNIEEINKDQNTCNIKPYCTDPIIPDIGPIPDPIGIIETTRLSEKKKQTLDELLSGFVDKFNKKLDESKILVDLLKLIHRKDDIERREGNTNKEVEGDDCLSKYSEIEIDIDSDAILNEKNIIKGKYEILKEEYKLFLTKVKDEIFADIEKSDYLKCRIHGIQDTLLHMEIRLDEMSSKFGVPRNTKNSTTISSKKAQVPPAYLDPKSSADFNPFHDSQKYDAARKKTALTNKKTNKKYKYATPEYEIAIPQNVNPAIPGNDYIYSRNSPRNPAYATAAAATSPAYLDPNSIFPDYDPAQSPQLQDYIYSRNSPGNPAYATAATATSPAYLDPNSIFPDYDPAQSPQLQNYIYSRNSPRKPAYATATMAAKGTTSARGDRRNYRDSEAYMELDPRSKAKKPVDVGYIEQRNNTMGDYLVPSEIEDPDDDYMFALSAKKPDYAVAFPSYKISGGRSSRKKRLSRKQMRR